MLLLIYFLARVKRQHILCVVRVQNFPVMSTPLMPDQALRPEDHKALVRLAEIASHNVVGRYYAEMLPDATSMALQYCCRAFQEGKAMPLCSRAAKNGAIDYLRSQIGRTGAKSDFYHAIAIDEPSTGLENTLSTEIDFERFLIPRFMERIVHFIRDRKQRRVLKLLYLEDKSTSETACKMRLSEGQVTRLRKNGLMALQQMVDSSWIDRMDYLQIFELLASGHRCRGCERIKPEEEFPKIAINVMCHDCQARSAERRRQRNRSYWVRDQYKRQKRKVSVITDEVHGCILCQRILPINLFPAGHLVHCLECRLALRAARNPCDPNPDRAISFVRACWHAAWDNGLLKGERYISRRPTKDISGIDAAKRHPNMATAIIALKLAIPKKFILAWFATPSSEFSIKIWATKYRTHLTTVMRWIHQIWDHAQVLLKDLPEIDM